MKKAIEQDMLKTIKRIIIFFVLTSLLIAFFVPLLFYFSIIQSDESNTKVQINTVENIFDSKSQDLIELADNPLVASFFIDREADLWDINRLMYEQKNRSRTSYDFFVLTENGNIEITNHTIIYQAYRDKFFKGMMDFNNHPSTDVVIKKVTASVPKEEDLLIMYKSVLYEDEIVGYVVFTFNGGSFNFLKSQDSRYIFSDKYNNVIFTDVPELARSSGTYRHVLSEKEWKTLSGYHHTETNFSRYPYKMHRYYAITYTLRFIYMAIMLVAVLSILIIVMHRIYYRRLIKDNLHFAYLIREAILSFSKGDLSYRITHENEEPTQTDHFIDKYNDVLDLVEETIKSNNMMQELAKDAERRLLHSQFNPHFIFNVLETIRYSLPPNAHESEEMIESLSKIMKYSVYVTQDIVKLEQDVQYIKEYLNLQKLRYEERLNYKLNIDADALNIEVPKLIIQPLVENSIKHGFKDEMTLNIDVSANMFDDNVMLVIKDDGVGIESNELRNLQERIDKIVNGLDIDESEHVGVLNTVKRLRHFFPDSYQFFIESVENHGTIITLVIKGESHE